MKIGTKSILFGAHCFFLHPWFVAFAWWKLYGFPFDPRLWVAFIVHDLGYWGKPNMDGPEGETHPELGARIMGWLFDWNFAIGCQWYTGEGKERRICSRTVLRVNTTGAITWSEFVLYHSRFYSKKNGQVHSRLCVADKLAFALMPAWLYLPMVNWTGEIREYMDPAHHETGGRYSNECRILSTQREWLRSAQEYTTRWAEEHKDCRPDRWTFSTTKEAA